jgi:hypothetical protein
MMLCKVCCTTDRIGGADAVGVAATGAAAAADGAADCGVYRTVADIACSPPAGNGEAGIGTAAAAAAVAGGGAGVGADAAVGFRGPDADGGRLSTRICSSAQTQTQTERQTIQSARMSLQFCIRTSDRSGVAAALQAMCVPSSLSSL